MRAVPARVGERYVDTITPITSQIANRLKGAGIDGAIRYLGSITKYEARDITDAGLGLMVVTYANAFVPEAAIMNMEAIGYPEGATCWLDVEGKALYNKYKNKPDATPLIGSIDSWADKILEAKWMPGEYAGVPNPLTSEEHWKLHVQRYWKGQGQLRDRFDKLTEPYTRMANGQVRGGYCNTQMAPSVTWAGHYVDVNVIGGDYLGRVPMVAVK